MCIISFQFQQHPKYKLIIAANRDEFYDRPTKEAHFWEDKKGILAGRDLRANGTWLGITKKGKFGALTNYRAPNQMNPDKRSRGDIITNFLTSDLTAVEYLEQLNDEKDEYNGFNVLVGTPDELYYYSNQLGNIEKITTGTHSISNEFLNSPWPKVEKAKKMLSESTINDEKLDEEVLFAQLADDILAPDDQLPNTGIDPKFEKQVSSIFIRTDGYGTRSSTVILITHDNEVTFTERTFNDGSFKHEQKFQFHIN